MTSFRKRSFDLRSRSEFQGVYRKCACMVLYVPFPLISYATRLLSVNLFWPFDPHPGGRGVCKDIIYTCMVFYCPFPLIWYATWLRARCGCGWGVCVRACMRVYICVWSHCWFYLIVLKYTVKVKKNGLADAKLFHFDRIFHNGVGWGQRGDSIEPPWTPSGSAFGYNWTMSSDFQQCGMCDQQSLRSACAFAQSDQRLC